eukprot:9472662-Pyramimonas_sp.AAC.1
MPPLASCPSLVESTCNGTPAGGVIDCSSVRRCPRRCWPNSSKSPNWPNAPLSVALPSPSASRRRPAAAACDWCSEVSVRKTCTVVPATPV